MAGRNHTVSVRPTSTVARPSDMTWAAYALDKDGNGWAPAGDYGRYRPMAGTGNFTTNASVVVTSKTTSTTNDYITSPIYVVIRVKSPSLQKAGPNGMRDAQSAIYKVTTTRSGTSSSYKYSCSVSSVVIPS